MAAPDRSGQRKPVVIHDLDGRPLTVVPAQDTLGFKLGHDTRASSRVRAKGSQMLRDMDSYRLLWHSKLTWKQEVERYYSLVASKVIWGLHLLPLLPADFRYLEYIHARCLRRILGKKSAYFSHISHKDIRDLTNTCTMESIIRRKQLTHFFLGNSTTA